MTVFQTIRYEISWRAFAIACRLLGMGRAEMLFDRLFWHRPLIDEDEIYGDE